MKNRKYLLTTINGIKTILYPIKGVEAIKLELNVKAGAGYEKGENWGAFHLLEHLTHQGTKKFSTRFEIEDFKEKHGLKTNAYTSNSRVGYWAKASRLSLEPALTWLNELVFNPTFPEESFEKEVSVITNEYKDHWDKIGNRFWKSLVQQLHGKNHPYNRDALGQPEYIKTLTRKDIIKLHRKYITAKKCCLTITGKFTIKQAEEAVKKILQPKFKDRPTLPKIKTLKPSAKKIIHYEDIDQEEIVLTWPLPGFKQISLTEKLAIGVANYILGVGSNSILNSQIREKYGLAYWVAANRYFRDDVGRLEVRTSIDPKNEDKCLKLLKELIYSFVSNPIEPKRLLQAKRFMDLQTSINFDSVDNINNTLIDNLLDYGRPIFPEEYVEIGKQVTPELVSRIIKKHITPEKELLAIMKRKIL